MTMAPLGPARIQCHCAGPLSSPTSPGMTFFSVRAFAHSLWLGGMRSSTPGHWERAHDVDEVTLDELRQNDMRATGELLCDPVLERSSVGATDPDETQLLAETG